MFSGQRGRRSMRKYRDRISYRSNDFNQNTNIHSRSFDEPLNHRFGSNIHDFNNPITKNATQLTPGDTKLNLQVPQCIKILTKKCISNNILFSFLEFDSPKLILDIVLKYTNTEDNGNSKIYKKNNFKNLSIFLKKSSGEFPQNYKRRIQKAQQVRRIRSGSFGKNLDEY